MWPPTAERRALESAEEVGPVGLLSLLLGGWLTMPIDTKYPFRYIFPPAALPSCHGALNLVPGLHWMVVLWESPIASSIPFFLPFFSYLAESSSG